MPEISLGIPYIQAVNIKGIEYLNTDYIAEQYVNLGINYIKSIKAHGIEYINLDYKNSHDEIE